MANLPELAEWTAGIYQLEEEDPVLGGENGIDNLQAKQLANRTLWLKALAELAAPRASPVFTGTPTAPTASLGDNSLKLANTAFVQATIAALVASSPAALDTLNELAAALGNDPNFATTVTNALAAKAPLASPALTGLPTGPTASASTSTDQLATTAFVQLVARLCAPAGAVTFTASSTAPAGWIKANGAAVSRSAYAALFAAIGTTFGVGDGSTTFNLPDLRAEIIRGFDDGRGIDGGRVFGSLQAATTISDRMKYTSLAGNQGEICPDLNNTDGTVSSGTAGYQISTSFTTPQSASRFSIRPRNVALLACIKY